MDKPTHKKVGRFNVLLVPQLPEAYTDEVARDSVDGADDATELFDGVTHDAMSSGCTGCAFNAFSDCRHPIQRTKQHELKECWMTSLMFLPVKRWEWYMKHRVIAASQGYELLTLEEARKRLP